MCFQQQWLNLSPATAESEDRARKTPEIQLDSTKVLRELYKPPSLRFPVGGQGAWYGLATVKRRHCSPLGNVACLARPGPTPEQVHHGPDGSTLREKLIGTSWFDSTCQRCWWKNATSCQWCHSLQTLGSQGSWGSLGLQPALTDVCVYLFSSQTVNMSLLYLSVISVSAQHISSNYWF